MKSVVVYRGGRGGCLTFLVILAIAGALWKYVIDSPVGWVLMYLLVVTVVYKIVRRRQRRKVVKAARKAYLAALRTPGPRDWTPEEKHDV